ncbi:MAG: hypothetical protein R2882_13500, partial [Gemmatimonadales bacterium]
MRGISLSSLALILAGCAGTEVHPAPVPSGQIAKEWQEASPANLEITRLLLGNTFPWGAWRREGPIRVVEDGVTSTWRGTAVEYRYRGVPAPNPCRIDGGITVTLWRPLPDSSGIDVVWLNVVYPRTPGDETFGPRRPCPLRDHQPAGTWISRFVSRQRRWEPGSVGVAGQAHVGVLGGSAPGTECRLVQGESYGEDCEEITAAVTIRASLAVPGGVPDTGQPITRDLIIGPASLPGLRFYDDCRSLSSCDTVVPWMLEPPRSHFFRRENREKPSYRASVGGVPVHRTMVLARFEPGIPDSIVAATLYEWSARMEWRGFAGSMVIQIPDPGPAAGAFEAAVGRMAAHPGVEAMLPIPADTAAAAGSPLLDRGRVA